LKWVSWSIIAHPLFPDCSLSTALQINIYYYCKPAIKRETFDADQEFYINTEIISFPVVIYWNTHKWIQFTGDNFKSDPDLLFLQDATLRIVTCFVHASMKHFENCRTSLFFTIREWQFGKCQNFTCLFMAQNTNLMIYGMST
jgi:hypothetical protein